MSAKGNIIQLDSKTSASTDKSREDSYSRASKVLNPVNRAALNLRAYNKTLGELDLSALAKTLTEQTNEIISGNMQPSEVMLSSQAYTLDTIFNTLARRAADNIGTNYDAVERYLKLAFKAQSHCRTTLEAISTIQNPPLAGYINQANIAHTQQVNNNQSVSKQFSRTRKTEKLRNKLLEVQDGKRLDSGTASTSGTIDPEVETVAAVHQTKDRKRQTRSCL